MVVERIGELIIWAHKTATAFPSSLFYDSSISLGTPLARDLTSQHCNKSLLT